MSGSSILGKSDVTLSQVLNPAASEVTFCAHSRLYALGLFNDLFHNDRFILLEKENAG